MSASKPLPVESLLPFQSPRTTMSDTAATPHAPAREGSPHHSTDSGAEDDDSSAEKPAKRQKRSRACQACRAMKIRCKPVEGQEACLSCSKVNRQCVMPGPAKKRQKTVHKVAELEKKINALTDALIAKNQANLSPPTDPPSVDKSTPSRSDTINFAEKPATSEHYDRVLHTQAYPFEKGEAPIGCGKGPTETGEAYVDVIDRGIVNMEDATAMFDHWKYKMQPYFPVVGLQDDVQAGSVRTSSPILFGSILCVASPAIRPDLQPQLNTEINYRLSQKVMFYGEKSIELVHALLTYVSYYTRCREARDLAFNQYIHAAVVMSLDLGMGKRSRRELQRDPAEDAIARRTWLACYYVASNVATLLRHPSLVRWSPYVEECIHFFGTSSFASPSDKVLCALVNIQHIAEEVSIVFNMDDPASNVSFTEAKTQYHLRTFERQIVAWKQSVGFDGDPRLVEHISSCIELYVHEIAIHHEHNVDDFRPPFDPPRAELPGAGSHVTSAHIEALTTCLDACHRVLRSYLAIDLPLAQALPNLYFVWNTYAAVALIKLHGILTAPDSKLGSILTPDLKVEYFLDSMIAKHTELSKDGRCPPAEAFGFVLQKLRSWHIHKKGNLGFMDARLEVASPISSTPALPLKADRGSTKFGFPNIMPPTSWVPPGGAQTDLNAAYDAANYNINWSDLNFSADELNAFDSYMTDVGWMGYLI